MKIAGDGLQKSEHDVRHINFNRVGQKLAKTCFFNGSSKSSNSHGTNGQTEKMVNHAFSFFYMILMFFFDKIDF